jgi:uncharacterized membrane protein YeaQ/YmgE (transglycosylase-associated protein family)
VVQSERYLDEPGEETAGGAGAQAGGSPEGALGRADARLRHAVPRPTVSLLIAAVIGALVILVVQRSWADVVEVAGAM